MLHGRGLKRHTIARAEQSVHALVFVEEIERARHVLRRVRVTGVVQRDGHEQRLRRERVEQIRPIDAASERRHDILLGIVGRSRRLDVVLREVLGVALGNHGDLDAAVERREKLRQRSAARLAAAADPFGIDFRAREQVVDSADAVPGAKEAEVRAEQDEAAPRVLVLGGSSAADRRLAGARSRILDALALSERVVGEHHVAFARQVREQLLVAGPRLAIRRMSERSENRRTPPGPDRHVEIRRDVQARPALEHQLLDAIARPLEDAGHARVERRSLERAAEHLPELRDDGGLPIDNLLTRRDRVDDVLAPFARLVREAYEISLEIVGIIGQRRAVGVQRHTRCGRRTTWRLTLTRVTGTALEARRPDNKRCAPDKPAARALHDVSFRPHFSSGELGILNRCGPAGC